MAPTATFTNGHAANGNSHPAVQQHAAVCDPTAARHDVTESVRVESPNVSYTDDHILSNYTYNNTHVTKQVNADGTVAYTAKPSAQNYSFRTGRKVPKTGLMLVGLGGNNGTTITAAIIANRKNLTWHNKEGLQTANYYGSLVRASTVKLGMDPETGKDVFVPFSSLVPMVHPNDFVIGGWDISGMPLDQAMARAKVLDYDLQTKVAAEMATMKPLPSVYYPDFIAANQEERADNVLPGNNKAAHVEQIRKDIRDFKANNGLDSVVVVWTANTERYADIIPGVNDTADNLLKAVEQSHEEVSPSTIFAIACILENAPYVNGAPQNTFVPGATKKSVDGKVVADKGEHPDHCIVIKYMPGVSDTKVAMDDYTSELMLGGRNRLYLTNLCEDSLLASPLILDLAIMAELMTRIQYSTGKDVAFEDSWEGLHSIMSLLSYSLKAPQMKGEVVNALSRQRAAVTNMLRALIGLPPDSDLDLESRVW